MRTALYISMFAVATYFGIPMPAQAHFHGDASVPANSGAVLRPCIEGGGLISCAYYRLTAGIETVNRGHRTVSRRIDRDFPGYDADDVAFIESALEKRYELLFDFYATNNPGDRRKGVPRRYFGAKHSYQMVQEAADYLIAVWVPTQQYCQREGSDPVLVVDCEIVLQNSVADIQQLQVDHEQAYQNLLKLFTEAFHDIGIDLEQY